MSEIDILEELKQKTLNATTPSWANRAADEIINLRAQLAKVPDGWESVKDKLPPEGESYLVMLAPENPVDWTTTRPVVAEYRFIVGLNWSVFDPWSHANVEMDGYVLFWQSMPKPRIADMKDGE